MPASTHRRLRLRWALVATAATALAACVAAGPASSRVSATPNATGLILSNDSPGGLTPRGATGFFVLYQDAVPGASSGSIDVARTIAAIRRERSLPEYGMLDFEDPYSEVLKAGASHPLHEKVVRTLVETMRAVRREFPRTKWTYWGFPEAPFWIGKDSESTWATATPAERDAATRRAVLGNRDVLVECDWVSPWAYDLYDARTAPKPEYARGESEGTRAWIEAKIAITRACFTDAKRAARPIIPCVSPLYGPGGRATADDPVPLVEFRLDLIDPIVRARVDGVALWSPLRYFVEEASSPASGIATTTTTEKRRWVRVHLLGGSEPRDWKNAKPMAESRSAEFVQRYIDAIASSARGGQP